MTQCKGWRFNRYHEAEAPCEQEALPGELLCKRHIALSIVRAKRTEQRAQRRAAKEAGRVADVLIAADEWERASPTDGDRWFEVMARLEEAVRAWRDARDDNPRGAWPDRSVG